MGINHTIRLSQDYTFSFDKRHNLRYYMESSDIIDMNRKEKVAMQDEYMDTLIKNLPVLRAATSMTQAQLAEKVGVSRQTIVAIETRKRPMPWSLYLATILVS